MAKASTADDVLNASAKRRIDPCKGLQPWNLTLFMRSMTEREKAEHEASLLDAESGKLSQPKLKRARASLIASVICDEDGKLVFRPEHVRVLMDRDSKLVDLLDTQCRAHVGMYGGKKNDSPFDSTSDDDEPSDSP